MGASVGSPCSLGKHHIEQLKMANSSVLFLLAIFICGWENAFSKSVNLPGVAVLNSGFDALALTSRNKIFDFDKTPGDRVHVGADSKRYTAPELVNVVTDGSNSKLVDDSCINVAHTFEDYLSTYKRSIQFNAGVDIKNFSLLFHAHHDVEDVYHAITDNSQAVGVSESWWGMYEMSVPPAFLLNSKLSPIFAATKKVLLDIGTPTTDEHQQLYNQVCCDATAFGTHYVGSLIVGGRVTVESFINSSFHEEYSKHTVDNQVSLNFEFTKLKFSLDAGAPNVTDHIMKDYIHNSRTKTTFQPDSTRIQSDPAPWLAWEKTAAKNPIEVNKSLNPLAHLFFEAPEVMTHLQKTIDFYLRNGMAPQTLTEVNGTPEGGLLDGSEQDKQPKPLVSGLNKREMVAKRLHNGVSFSPETSNVNL